MTTSPERILVHVTGDRLGDGLLKYPVIRAFRETHPRTHITWVTSRRPSIFSGPLACLTRGLIDELHSETGLGRSAIGPLPAFLAPRYDVVVATESRALETLALRRIPHGSFIAPGLRFSLSSRRPELDYKSLTSYEQFRVLMSLAAGVSLTPEARIELPEEIMQCAEQCFRRSRVHIGLSPGAGGARKRWPLENYIELARLLASKGITPTFFLGPEDVGMARSIRASVPGAIFAEQLLEQWLPRSPLNTVAAARMMRASIANDSGGGHLVAAGGRPLLTLYGHTDPRKFRSPYCPHTALRPMPHAGRSLTDISVEDAARHLDGIAAP